MIRGSRSISPKSADIELDYARKWGVRADWKQSGRLNPGIMEASRDNPDLQRAFWLITQLFVKWITIKEAPQATVKRVNEWTMLQDERYPTQMFTTDFTCARRRKLTGPANSITSMDFCQGRMTWAQNCRSTWVIRNLTAGKQGNN